MPVVLGKHIDSSYYELDHRFAVLDKPSHKSSQKLIAYWRSCDAKGGMRMGRDIPARAIAPLLSQIMIYEPIANWDDVVVPYAGFGLAKFFGGDITGLPYSQIIANDRGNTLQQLFSEAPGIAAG